MPSYEMVVILRTLARPQLQQTIKQAVDTVVKNGGIIRAFENLGERQLPYSMRTHTGIAWRGNYFSVKFDSPVSTLEPLRDHLQRDDDVLHNGILRTEEEIQRPCEIGPCDWGELTEEKRMRQELRTQTLIKKY